jgi:hypothetical protein
MARVFGEDTGKGFVKEEPFEIFVKAIESAIYKSPVRKTDKIFLSDLWFITSLPYDILIEAIEKHSKDMNIPEDINYIYDEKNNKNIWQRQKNSDKEHVDTNN